AADVHFSGVRIACAGETIEAEGLAFEWCEHGELHGWLVAIVHRLLTNKIALLRRPGAVRLRGYVFCFAHRCFVEVSRTFPVAEESGERLGGLRRGDAHAREEEEQDFHGR